MEARDRRCIMLVEDEVLIALTQINALKELGYDTVHARTGEDALRIMESGRPSIDLILMDINLGKGMDGTETARRILRLFDIPIIFLTAYSDPHTVGKTESVSAYGYVIKNAGQAVLGATIAMAFKLYTAYRGIHELNRMVEERNHDLSVALTELEHTVETLQRRNEELEQSRKTILEQQSVIDRGEIAYRSLVRNMANGLAVLRLVLDEHDLPVDCHVIDANDAFESVSGLQPHQIIGRTVREVVPDFKNEWMERLSRAALSGQRTTFEYYSRQLRRDCAVTTYQTAPGHCACEFRIIDPSKEDQPAIAGGASAACS